jgi:hypothetical protein
LNGLLILPVPPPGANDIAWPYEFCSAKRQSDPFHSDKYTLRIRYAVKGPNYLLKEQLDWRKKRFEPGVLI